MEKILQEFLDKRLLTDEGVQKLREKYDHEYLLNLQRHNRIHKGEMALLKSPLKNK